MVTEMYVHTSAFLRNSEGQLINKNGEILRKVAISSLPENIAKALQTSEKNLQRKRGEIVSVRKHVYVNDKGEISEPAPNPLYSKRRATICCLYNEEEKTAKLGAAVCAKGDIHISRYRKQLGREIAKARALKKFYSKNDQLSGKEKKEIVPVLFNVLHEVEQKKVII